MNNYQDQIFTTDSVITQEVIPTDTLSEHPADKTNRKDGNSTIGFFEEEDGMEGRVPSRPQEDGVEAVPPKTLLC